MSKLRTCAVGHELYKGERVAACSQCRGDELRHEREASEAEQDTFLRNLREKPAPLLMTVRESSTGHVQVFQPGRRPDRRRRR